MFIAMNRFKMFEDAASGEAGRRKSHQGAASKETTRRTSNGRHGRVR